MSQTSDSDVQVETVTEASPATTAATTATAADEARSRRKVREGLVVSNKMDKTVVVLVDAGQLEHHASGLDVRDPPLR